MSSTNEANDNAANRADALAAEVRATTSTPTPEAPDPDTAGNTIAALQARRTADNAVKANVAAAVARPNVYQRAGNVKKF